MKKTIWILFISAVSALVLSSCDREKLTYDEPAPEVKTTGQLNLKSMKVNYQDNSEAVQSAPASIKNILKATSAVSTSSFIVKVLNSDNVEQGKWIYSAMPEIITLKTGSYKIAVYSQEEVQSEWETPYYYAEKDFVINESSITNIGTLLCTLHNIKVTVTYDEKLKALLGEDCTVNISIGKGQLKFSKEETRAGYFKAEKEENVLTAEFSGTVDGETDVQLYKVFTSVKAGQHRIVKFTLKDTDNSSNQEEGSASAGITLDASCTIIDKNISVDAGEEIIPDDPKPEPEPEPEPDNSPSITGKDFDINKAQKTSELSTVIVLVSCPEGETVTGMTVDIKSPTLTPEELINVGLNSHLDLVNPGEQKQGLIDLGLPWGDQVKGQNNLKMDISQFVPLLSLLGPGTHKFEIKVISSSGQSAIKTLTLVTE